MCVYFNALASGTAIPREGLLAHILDIPKDGKDHTVPSSYRWISLLNNDIRILAKILANHLKLILPTVIHSDQTGFIMGMEARENSNHAIQLIHWARTQTDHPTCLLHSSVAEKAFDRVNWTYLQAVLMNLGFGPNMLTWMAQLYNSPESLVRVNEVLFDSFPICNKAGMPAFARHIHI